MAQNEDKSAHYCIFGTKFDAPELAPGLYVVATPIGNLRDISIRALQTLAAADLILCEDTRQSARLLDHYLINTSKSSLHEHNERAKSASIIEKIKKGAAIALISDAGTPLISDPGFPLVQAAREQKIDIFALPGASALLGGLMVAGLPTDQFTFVGFLPVKQNARLSALKKLADASQTLVFYESARRLEKTITAMIEIYGPDRKGAISLELTKKFERTLTGPLTELLTELENNPPRGEAVILLAGAAEKIVDEDMWLNALKSSLVDLPLRSAVDEISARFGVQRKKVYDAALKLKQ
ncbi:MAG: 16S rRNA (cytidine(1402)-2'-O)-methyltransferase [Devosiaceae bacterium]|nr:16S rRNA (cytidine(1402)-2'-O)-methyltransferase [Devosiaceae bacterium]